ncbi:MAG: hypothetical protein AB7P12_17715, partial [Alphaproteobacteria bacterium]
TMAPVPPASQVTMSRVLSILAAAGWLGASTPSWSADSSYSDALKLKQQIDQQTGGGAKSSGPPAGNATNPNHIDAPKRKAGWWEFAAVSAAGSPMATQNLCVGDASEKVYSAFDQITGELVTGTRCSKRDFHKDGAGWAFDTKCSIMEMPGLGDFSTAAKGMIVGDISSKYEVRQTVVSSGQTTTGVIKAAHKGACPAGRREGDLVDSGGTLLVNMLD